MNIIHQLSEIIHLSWSNSSRCFNALHNLPSWLFVIKTHPKHLTHCAALFTEVFRYNEKKQTTIFRQCSALLHKSKHSKIKLVTNTIIFSKIFRIKLIPLPECKSILKLILHLPDLILHNLVDFVWIFIKYIKPVNYSFLLWPRDLNFVNRFWFLKII